MEAKEVLRIFKAAPWSSQGEVEAFCQQTGTQPASEMMKLVGVLQEKVGDAPQQQKNRFLAFATLVDRSRDRELFVPFIKALRSSDQSIRALLVGLLPKVNNVTAHAELCALLGDRDIAVRKTAAQALKQIAGDTVFSVLTSMVGQPNMPGRMEAMEVLVHFSRHHSLAALQTVLSLGTQPERIQALRYLGDPQTMAKDRGSALQAIATALQDADEPVSLQAITSAAAVCTEEEFFVHLSPALDSPSFKVIKTAMQAMVRFQGPRVVAALERKLRMGPKTIRLGVLEAAEAVGNDTVLPILAEALSHKQIEVRTRAGEVLTRLSSAAKLDIARTVLWLMRSRDPNVRRMAAEVARKVGDAAGDLWPKLLVFLRDEDWWVRERIMDALVDMAGTKLTRHMVSYLQDPSDVVRRYGAEMLARLKDPQSLGLLIRQATSDPDWWVKERCVEALAAINDKRAVPYLVEFLNRDDNMRLATLDALSAMRATEAAPHIANLLKDVDPGMRMALLRTLGTLDDPGVASKVADLVADPDIRIRNLASEMLVRWSYNVDANASRQDALRGKSLLDQILIRAANAGADDLILQAGKRPYMKRLGRVEPLFEEQLTQEQIRAILAPHLSSSQLKELEALADVDFSYEVKSEARRFRANIFTQHGGLGAVFRTVKAEVMELDGLGLPKIVTTFGDLKNGLVLVGGPTGSGKSTTLAGIIDYINKKYAKHIISLEDPIEYIHSRKNCLVNQREIGAHAMNFHSALRATLREDPDVILVGEMRDLDTISFAVSAAETGHLVFGTVHTVSADSSVDRMINAFPPNQQPQVRAMLADSLRAVVCQHLLRRVDRPGRVLAVEVMVNNEAVASLIRKGKSYQIQSTILTSREAGMQTMDQDLRRLLNEGKVSPDEVFMKANNKKEFEELSGEKKEGSPEVKPPVAGGGSMARPPPSNAAQQVITGPQKAVSMSAARPPPSNAAQQVITGPQKVVSVSAEKSSPANPRLPSGVAVPKAEGALDPRPASGSKKG